MSQLSFASLRPKKNRPIKIRDLPWRDEEDHTLEEHVRPYPPVLSQQPGHTTIYDPNGREVARSRELTEELLTFNIPKEALHTSKGKRVHGSPVLMKQLLPN